MKIVLNKADVEKILLDYARDAFDNEELDKVEISSYSSDFATISVSEPTPVVEEKPINLDEIPF